MIKILGCKFSTKNYCSSYTELISEGLQSVYLQKLNAMAILLHINTFFVFEYKSPKGNKILTAHKSKQSRQFGASVFRLKQVVNLVQRQLYKSDLKDPLGDTCSDVTRQCSGILGGFFLSDPWGNVRGFKFYFLNQYSSFPLKRPQFYFYYKSGQVSNVYQNRSRKYFT